MTVFAKSLRLRALGWSGLIALGLSWSGCSIIPQATEDPTRYFLLTESAIGAASSAPHGHLSVGVRRVELPGYLASDRTMVVRRGSNEIRYQEYARWAEPLDTALQHIVRDRLLGNEAVASAELAPFRLDGNRDYDVNVRVERCEGKQDADGNYVAELDAVFEITDPHKENAVVTRRRFEAKPVRWDGSNYGALADALSTEAKALGDEIAAALPH
ncbi:MAG TPA: PqiC family protein [Opitutaceae bacterium]